MNDSSILPVRNTVYLFEWTAVVPTLYQFIKRYFAFATDNDIYLGKDAQSLLCGWRKMSASHHNLYFWKYLTGIPNFIVYKKPSPGVSGKAYYIRIGYIQPLSELLLIQI